MIFFHPDIAYKEYKNDLAILNQIPEGQLIELGLSLDRAYTISEISKILLDMNISWCWVNAYRSEDLERYKKEARDYDAKAAFIGEYEALGVSLGPNLNIKGFSYFPSRYNDFLFNLKVSENEKFLEIYNDLENKGYTDPSKVPLLGVIVYGTKDQLKSLTANPHIKASSLGVVTNKF